MPGMRVAGALACASMFVAAGAMAQDISAQEVVVTGLRADQDGYERDMPAVGLRRQADFLVQSVIIRGDTRDGDAREREIRMMLARAIAMAGGAGVELAYGDFILSPLTATSADALELRDDKRPDSAALDFLVKAPLAESTPAAARARIRRFLDTVPEIGRAQIDMTGEPTLSIVAPDRYRPDIAAAIAADAQAMAERVGPGYAVEIEGLSRPVDWARSGADEVLLYLPYRLTVVPRP